MEYPAIYNPIHSAVLARCSSGLVDFRENYRIVRESGRRDWLMFLNLGGIGCFRYGGDELLVRAGSIVLIPPGIRQDYGLLKDGQNWRFLYAHFFPKVDWMPYLDLPKLASGVMYFEFGNSSAFEKVESALTEASDSIRSEIYLKSEKTMNAIERAILWAWEANPNSKKQHLDDRIEMAVRFIMRHVGKNLKIRDVAKEVGLSTSRFSHLFTEHVGVPFGVYLESLRLFRAREMLEGTSHLIGEIARNVGFEDALYFSKRFKRLYGISPRDCRRGYLL